jgi:hypothetical protein
MTSARDSFRTETTTTDFLPTIRNGPLVVVTFRKNSFPSTMSIAATSFWVGSGPAASIMTVHGRPFQIGPRLSESPPCFRSTWSVRSYSDGGATGTWILPQATFHGVRMPSSVRW